MSRQRIITKRVGYPSSSLISALDAPSNMQLDLASCALVNGTTGVQHLGIGISMSSTKFSFYNQSSGVLTLQTGAMDLFSTTNNDGFVIASKDIFSLVALSLSSPGAGTPTYVFQYWNGSSWATLNLNIAEDFSNSLAYVLFSPPVDWVAGNNFAGVDTSLYCIQVKATTAPSGNVQADAIKLCKMISYREQVEAKQSIEASFLDGQYLLEQGEGIFPFFSVPNANNTLEIVYRINP